MTNLFYRRELARKIEGEKMEAKLRFLAVNEESFTAEDVMVVLDCFDEQILSKEEIINSYIVKINKIENKREKLLSMPQIQKVLRSQLFVENLALSARTYNCLMKADIVKVSTLCNKNEEELRAIRGLGKKGTDEITEALAEYGLSLSSFHEQEKEEGITAEQRSRLEEFFDMIDDDSDE